MVRRLQGLSNRQVLVIILSVSLFTSVASAVLNRVYDVTSSHEWWVGWLQNFSTEMLGAFSTFLLIQLLVGSREEKGRLIRQMRSRDNALALQAVAELGAHGWLSDGSLNGAYLMTANLQGLRMWDTHLKSADLHGVNLQGAKLERVNFTGANLWNANLREIRLESVNLEGADLYQADLRDAYLLDVEFDERTRLPDGSKWKPETDMGRFTDPYHADFWDVEAIKSSQANAVAALKPQP